MTLAFEEANAAYQAAIRTGAPKHRWTTITSETIGLPPRRIREWANKYGWRNESAGDLVVP